MNTQVKSFLKVAAVSVAVSIVLIFALQVLFNISFIVSFIVGILVGCVVSVVAIARSRGEKPAEVAEEMIQQVIKPDPNAIKKRVETRLVNLNQTLRLGSPHASVIVICEPLIDALLDVVPRALQEAPNSEATYNLEKLSTDHLPELIINYLKLSGEDRSSAVAALVAQLTELETSVNKAKASLDAGNMDEFSLSATFIDAKMA